MSGVPSFKTFLESFRCSEPVSRLTHNFYRYPARFSDQFVRDTIRRFSRPGEIVLDAFVGGGTAIVEALAAGRHALGVDTNSLACFVSMVKTTPLSKADRRTIATWLRRLRLDKSMPRATVVAENAYTRNLPGSAKRYFRNALSWIQELQHPRQKRFARCVLLRAAQQALDCRDEYPCASVLMSRITLLAEVMLSSLDEFVLACQAAGISKNQITSLRTIIHRSVVGLESEHCLARYKGKVKLVLTSPPYPQVHVLYHRWQLRGRKETPAPYWLSGLNDGQGGAYYTLGSRSAFGVENYFRTVSAAFSSLRWFLHADALVVQLVGFSKPKVQLKRYLEAMSQAGYIEERPAGLTRTIPLWRRVPNRKWYTRRQRDQSASAEILLFHRLKH